MNIISKNINEIKNEELLELLDNNSEIILERNSGLKVYVKSTEVANRYKFKVYPLSAIFNHTKEKFDDEELIDENTINVKGELLYYISKEVI